MFLLTEAPEGNGLERAHPHAHTRSLAIMSSLVMKVL